MSNCILIVDIPNLRSRFLQSRQNTVSKFGGFATLKTLTLCKELFIQVKLVMFGKKLKERVVKELAAPHMIMYYIKYKTGVDTMDQMVSRYTCHRRTQRCSLAIFFNTLDVGALAAYLIYYENKNMLKTKTNQRRIFWHQLSEELARIVL